MERWAVEIVEALRNQTKNTDDGFMFARVNTSWPLTLRAHDQIISKHLFRNPSLSLLEEDEVLVLKSGCAFYILLRVVPV